MSCRHKRDSAVWHVGILVCAQEGHLFFIQSNIWLHSLRRSPQITGFTVMGYPPLLLSDKINTSQLLALLTLWLLMPESEFVFHLALTSPARPSITPVYRQCSCSVPPPLQCSSCSQLLRAGGERTMALAGCSGCIWGLGIYQSAEQTGGVKGTESWRRMCGEEGVARM